MSETLRLDAAFRITNRGGLFLTTHDWSGTLRVGDSVQVPDAAGGFRLERITALEDVRKLDEQGQPIPCIGLELGDVRDCDIEILQALLAPGMTLTVDPTQPK